MAEVIVAGDKTLVMIRPEAIGDLAENPLQTPTAAQPGHRQFHGVSHAMEHGVVELGSRGQLEEGSNLPRTSGREIGCLSGGAGISLGPDRTTLPRRTRRTNTAAFTLGTSRAILASRTSSAILAGRAILAGCTRRANAATFTLGPSSAILAGRTSRAILAGRTSGPWLAIFPGSSGRAGGAILAIAATLSRRTYRTNGTALTLGTSRAILAGRANGPWLAIFPGSAGRAGGAILAIAATLPRRTRRTNAAALTLGPSSAILAGRANGPWLAIFPGSAGRASGAIFAIAAILSRRTCRPHGTALTLGPSQAILARRSNGPWLAILTGRSNGARFAVLAILAVGAIETIHTVDAVQSILADRPVHSGLPFLAGRPHRPLRPGLSVFARRPVAAIAARNAIFSVAAFLAIDPVAARLSLRPRFPLWTRLPLRPGHTGHSGDPRSRRRVPRAVPEIEVNPTLRFVVPNPEHTLGLFQPGIARLGMRRQLILIFHDTQNSTHRRNLIETIDHERLPIFSKRADHLKARRPPIQRKLLRDNRRCKPPTRGKTPSDWEKPAGKAQKEAQTHMIKGF